MRALVGYLLPNELETNAPSRLALGSEIALNKKCWRATRNVWRGMGPTDLARGTLGKWATFWLGTDQLLNPGHISARNRVFHTFAVVFYWGLLAVACTGLWQLRNSQPKVAALLLAYAVLMTLIHTPFVMDTRIRAPLIDPLIAILAGGGGFALAIKRQRNESTETVASLAASAQ